MTGKMAPGSKLIEAQIAEQLDVSRGPVREAIRQLVEEGLLEHVPYRGTVVRALTLKDIEELYSFRTLLESFAFKLVWPRRTPDFFAELDRKHELLLIDIEKQDQQAAIARELDLHGVVYAASEHRILLDSWNLLRSRLHFYFTIHQTAHQRAGALPDAHVGYVDKAKGADLQGMLAEIEEHMGRGLGKLREFVAGWNRNGAG